MQGLLALSHVQESAALAGLTSLRCLVLNTASNELLPGTAALTNLTSLSLQQLRLDEGVPRLQHLPQQLKELTMTLFGEQPHAVDLSHVTGLTRLLSKKVLGKDMTGLLIKHGVLLPPQLSHIAVDDVLSVQPLLQLQCLQRLELHLCSPKEVEHNLQLSTLTRLSDLPISVDAEEFELVADAWPRLPSLRSLQVGFWRFGRLGRHLLSVPGLRILPQVTALQHLRLHHLQLTTDSRVVDVFRGLSGLQSLGLQDCVVGVEENNSALFAGMVAAIASLPELRDLRLVHMPQWDEAASVALSSATQLTGRMVYGKEFASLVSQQVHKLRGLGSL
jgi:hypothetical protein